VYLGQHMHLERQAAIKVLHAQIAPANQKAFRREARTIAQLDHPHIIGIYDFDIQDQTPYLVMEYSPNGTLRQRHPSSSRLAFAQISTYVQQIAQALDYAHAHHVIHRDIKPENLLLNARGKVVLSDFGIAILSSPQASLSFQHPAGTPLYMAPEQIQGQPCAASDQYALAVMAYEWLCGQLPFRGSALAVTFQHVHEPPPRLREYLPEVPQTVEDAVLRALAKEPGQRFACVTDFATALQNALVSIDQDDGPNQFGETLRKSFEQIAHVHQSEKHEPASRGYEEPLAKKPEPAPAVSSHPAGSALPTLPQSFLRSSQTRKNHERMLRRLRRSYRELLAQSLQGIAWMELELTERPSAVQNMTNLTLRIATQEERPLPPGISIIQVYEDAEQELLILGEPGAGKSLLLLRLAQDLVEQAKNDESALLPVILPLSSWAAKRSTLSEWMIEQIAQAYDVPRKISEAWVKQEHILPLLDGLDEMDEAVRPACISAINAYHRAHFTPLVVCSRRAEYEVIADKERLALQTAVIIRPLTSEQRDAILEAAGGSLTSLRTVIQTQAAWQELATTPLMLQILMLTYQGTTVMAGENSETTLEEQVWVAYVERMVESKGNQKRYPLKQTRLWLSWLARQMREHNQTIFYAEHLQADWLDRKRQRWPLWLIVRLPVILLGMLISILITFLNAAFLEQSSLPLAALLGGFVGDLLIQQRETQTLGIKRRSPGPGSVLLSLLLAASLAWYLANAAGNLNDWLRDWIICGLVIGLSGWLIQLLLLLIGWPRIAPTLSQNIRRFLLLTMQCVLLIIVLGAVFGLSKSLPGLPQGLSFGLNFGFDAGVTGLFIAIILEPKLGTHRLAERLHWSKQHLFSFKHFLSSIFVGLGYLLFIELNSQFSDSESFLLYGGLSLGLGYWLFFGFYFGLVQNSLEDQDRRTFNQGIRRSLRNGAIISWATGLMIAAMIIVGYKLTYGLSGEKSNPHPEAIPILLSYTWLLFLCGMLIVWAWLGGVTLLRHYVIRLLLARFHTFPWRTRAFLDDATARVLMRRVGGGYSFIHRRLLDHFASSTL
jgi:serine/threonine protein kinase